MAAVLFLLGTFFTWIALYQGILAYAIGPPPDRELLTISGRIEDVATPWTRNRFVEATQVKIEVAPVRYVTVAVREVTMSTTELKALEGKPVTAVFAGLRPRNRWLYALQVEGRQLVSLETERARDIADHRRALALMVLNGLIAAGILVTAWRTKRPRPERIRGAQ